MAFRPPRFFFHPGQTFTPKTLLPLVARLGADSIFLAESAKIERPHRSHCKLHSLFHRFTFLPRHAEVLPHHTTKSVTYVLNLSCYLCSEPAPHIQVRDREAQSPTREARVLPKREERTRKFV